MIDNVKKFAVSNVTKIRERDFKSIDLFPTCSVATNLVTSLKFNPFRSATMLCHFDQTRSSYVANFFSFFAVALRRALLQATTLPFRNALAKMRNQVLELRNGLGRSLVLFPKVDLTDALILPKCIHVFSIIRYFLFLLILMKYVNSSYQGKSFVLLFIVLFNVLEQKKALWCHFFKL